MKDLRFGFLRKPTLRDQNYNMDNYQDEVERHKNIMTIAATDLVIDDQNES